MADTCIVCLGDLAGAEQPSGLGAAGDGAALGLGPSDDATPQEVAPATDSSKSKLDSSLLQPQTLPQPSLHNDPETIAHLLPCGHDLHNACLHPWVQRCNSCPICRQTFNVVELKRTVHGPCIDSYAVQDKRQQAEIDPRMVVDDDIFDEATGLESCIICERSDDEHVLLLCDGCNASCHTYCASLESVPQGAWYCQFCVEDGTAQTSPALPRTNRTSRAPRPRRQQARSRQDLAWTGVWQRIWTRLHFDVDFPFDDEEPGEPGRTIEERRELEEWTRRFRVAESQGAAARFRDTATALLEGPARRGQTPNPESQEELRAWNAFDKARDLEETASGTSRGRKRKSPTRSPAEPPPQAIRTLKRPRTRRPQEMAERPRAQAELPSSVRPRGDSSRAESSGRPQNGNGRSSSSDGKSFFHSLLKEVETSPSTPNATWPAGVSETGLFEGFSPVAASSSESPPLTGHPSPRSRSSSPPPFRLSRPHSPTPLSSTIVPGYLQRSASPVHSPERAIVPSSPTKASVSEAPPHVNDDASSTVPSLEQIRTTKAEIQAMVAIPLKKAYRAHEIDKDQYTDINRDVSRKLYSDIGEDEIGGFNNEASRGKWQAKAASEVDLALRALRATPPPLDVPAS